MRRILEELIYLACFGTVIGAVGQQPQAPPASQSGLSINARNYGAQCTGKGDDTAAIQAALDVQSAYNITALKGTNAEVELPPGTCVLSAPLRMGFYGSLVGQNDASTIYANYAAWHGRDYNAIDVSITGPVPSGESVAQRRIAHFRLFGGGNGAIPNSTGIHIHNTAATYDQQFQIPYFNIEDVFISGFDTGIEAEDWLSSSINNVNITAVRQGIFLNGHDVNIQIGHTNLAYSMYATPYTSNHGATVALLLAPNAKFCSNCTNYPQGIDFHDSSVVAFDCAVWVSHAIAVDIHDNILDYAAFGVAKTGAAIEISRVAAGLHIQHNLLSVLANSSAYGIHSTANAIDGIWIENNQFDNYAGKNNTDVGILIAGNGPTTDWHIDGNTFVNYRQGIQFNQAISYGDVRDNFGLEISGALVDLAGAPHLAYRGFFVDGNTSSSPVPVIKADDATGFTLGNNSGPSQITGTFSASGAGCTFSPGAVGNHCAATIHTPFNMIDHAYQVHGCTVTGANGVTTVGGVVRPISPDSFDVYETALSTTATGGGTISCEVTH